MGKAQFKRPVRDTIDGLEKRSSALKDLYAAINVNTKNRRALGEMMQIAIKANAEISKLPPEEVRKRQGEYLSNAKLIGVISGVYVPENVLVFNLMRLKGIDLDNTDAKFLDSERKTIIGLYNNAEYTKSTAFKGVDFEDKNKEIKDAFIGLDKVNKHYNRHLLQSAKEILDIQESRQKALIDNDQEAFQEYDDALNEIYTAEHKNLDLIVTNGNYIEEKEKLQYNMIKAKEASNSFKTKYAGISGFFKMIFNYSSYSAERDSVNATIESIKNDVIDKANIDTYINSNNENELIDCLMKVEQEKKISAQKDLETNRNYFVNQTEYYEKLSKNADICNAMLDERQVDLSERKKELTKLKREFLLSRISIVKDNDIKSQLDDIVFNDIQSIGMNKLSEDFAQYANYSPKMLEELKKKYPDKVKTVEVGDVVKSVDNNIKVARQLGCYVSKEEEVEYIKQAYKKANPQITEAELKEVEKTAESMYLNKDAEVNVKDSDVFKAVYKEKDREKILANMDKISKYSALKESIEHPAEINPYAKQLAEDSKFEYENYDDSIEHAEQYDTFIRNQLKNEPVPNYNPKGKIEKGVTRYAHFCNEITTNVEKRNEWDKKEVEVIAPKVANEEIKSQGELDNQLNKDFAIIDVDKKGNLTERQGAKDIVKENAPSSDKK